ncbi:MAG: oxygenase MpaB family protein [Nocardioides sp.]|uniref:oxygenase MpaB family protein n=1 Tax=Nocardioides sp. TaxID=35761 RepID=UPI00238A035C|nr:oxygenase MpaB family protein [Nocardioides sp.]MDE0775427.1 oxygenase MpaB family protein [Nocardioides sp.]
MTADPRPSGAPRPARDVPVPEGFDMGEHLSGLGAVLAGPANVIMQLSWPGVGYGVMNSRVHDGSAMLHPVKRARTTFGYIAVAMLGTDEERTAFRRAVNGQHAQVVSGPDEPVEYRAMDPRLQTWVAACLYYGTRDVLARLHGPMDEARADALYAHCARFGTTLQMPAEAWPETREAFDSYWEESLAEVSIDPPVADYLMRLTTLQNLPRLARGAASFNVFVTTGFLPPLFREQLGVAWSPAEQLRFDRLMRRLGRVERACPAWVRTLPFTLLLADLRRRIRRGKPLV